MNDILFTPLRLSELEALIQNSVEKAIKNVAMPSEPQPVSDELLTIQQASELLNLTKQTLYAYVHRSEIPVCKKGKRLYFSQQELTQWIKSGRKKTKEEIDQAAMQYLSKKGSRYAR